jgi:AbrB family looped-hinge helix DNA binding protein
MSTCKVDNQGRITTPASWRAAQGIQPGSELVILEEDGRLIVQTRDQAVRDAQAIVRQFIPAGISLTEELRKDRQRELEIEKRRRRG